MNVTLSDIMTVVRSVVNTTDFYKMKVKRNKLIVRPDPGIEMIIIVVIKPDHPYAKTIE